MRLDELVAELEGARIVGGDPGAEITALAYDSRRVAPGTLFFCVPGERADGHAFGPGAIADGAAALVVERQLEVTVPQIVVADARAAMAPLAARFFADPTATLRVVGVTGTNGKTTTAFLVRELLEAAGIQSGLMGTIKQVVGGTEEEVVRTTPEAIELQGTFRRMLDTGDAACAIEVSSHAMALHRADAIHFEAAVFTNLTQDHLDFHADMEDYFRAKRLLFAAGPGTAIVNVDDDYGRRLAGEFDCVTFSAEGAAGADLIAGDVSFDASGATFTVRLGSRCARALGGAAAAGDGGAAVEDDEEPADGEELAVRTKLPGHFNVANALGALAAALALGVEPRVAAAALAVAPAPPGRFEPVDEGQEFTVLVDYAHTPDSLENVLRAARRLTTGRLISVFGAGGDRDRDKRPKMGRAGAELSDLAIVTSDNPRSEAPEAIVAEVLTGTTGTGGEVESEVDRRVAIVAALRQAGPGDTVVIAGKGHEQGQEFEDGRKVPFDDREVAREELRGLGSVEGPA